MRSQIIHFGKYEHKELAAASFALVLCIGVPLLINSLSTDSGGKSPYPFDMLDVGESTTYKDGSVAFESLNENSFSFILTIENEEDELNYQYSYELKMNGWTSYDDGRDEAMGSEMLELLSITVNGEPAAEIPNTPGEYHITIDFTEIIAQDGTAHIADILMWGIASFNIDYHEN
ncbi:MAG: hypothetical protein ACI4C1_10145 [Lachnospiraceae bacterium]